MGSVVVRLDAGHLGRPATRYVPLECYGQKMPSLLFFFACTLLLLTRPTLQHTRSVARAAYPLHWSQHSLAVPVIVCHILTTTLAHTLRLSALWAHPASTLRRHGLSFPTFQVITRISRCAVVVAGGVCVGDAVEAM